MMKSKWLIVMFLFGQAADFLTTCYASKKFHAREINPWFRKWFVERKWGNILFFKTTAAILILFLTKPETDRYGLKNGREKFERAYNRLKLVTFVTWLPVISNLIQIVFWLHKEGVKNDRG